MVGSERPVFEKIKTWYTGDPESFKKVVEGCPVPVSIAGGSKAQTPRDVLEMVKGAVDAGAAGVTFERNVWRYENPVAMIAAIRKIVHEGSEVDVALDILNG